MVSTTIPRSGTAAKPMLPVGDAAEQFSLSRPAVRRLVRQHRVLGYVQDGEMFVDERSLRAYLSTPEQREQQKLSGDTLPIADAARLYGLSISRLARLAKTEVIRGEKRGGQWYLERHPLVTYITRNALPPTLVTIRGAAEILGLSMSRVKDLVTEGRLTARKRERGGAPQGEWVIEVADLKPYQSRVRPYAYVIDPPEWKVIGKAYRLHMKTNGLRDATVVTHSNAVGLFARWCQPQGIPVTYADREQVGAWLVERYELSRATGTNCVMAMRSFYGFCVKAGYRSDNPAEGLKVKRPFHEAKAPFTDDEVRALIAACRSLRDRTLLLFLMATGVRRGELVAMDVEDIDWDRALVLIRHGKGDRQRWAAPSPMVMALLREYVADRRGPVWLAENARRLPGIRLYKIVQKIARRAGVKDAYVHRFRVSFANLWMDQGKDLVALQGRMGHATIEMTAHYSRFNAAQRGLEQQRTMLDGLVDNGQKPGLERPAPSGARPMRDRPRRRRIVRRS